MRNIPMLGTGEVHIWRIPLSQARSVHALRGWLAPDEIKRADAFHFDRHRQCFIVAHAALRQILSWYVNVAPQELVFVYGEQGKPGLALECGGDRVRFNLSHSGCFALLAIAEESSLGIDIELINAEFAGEDIAERFFSCSEVNVLRALAEDSRADAFFSCWTRKEAYIKALGGGLSIPLDSFDVAFGPGVPTALLRTPAMPDTKQWSLYDIPAPHGYKAALVVEGGNHHLGSFFLDPSGEGLHAVRSICA